MNTHFHSPGASSTTADKPGAVSLLPAAPGAPSYWWSEAENLLLERLVAEGLSASQIGAQMGRSRNAVIGRCLRKGLRLMMQPGWKSAVKLRQPAAKPNPAAKAKPAPKPARPKTPTPPKFELICVPITPRMVPLVDLQPGECKWPYGDPRESGFGYCGHARAESRPYCSGHAALAFVPIQPRPVQSRVSERPHAHVKIAARADA